jgi:hypothetical protein
MPCRDYEDDRNWVNDDLRKQNDKLARIACNALSAFQESYPEACNDFLSTNKEAKTWWSEHQLADAAAKAEKERKAHEKKVKREALSKLSEEERRILGLK